jgi:cell wall-associated NlpC family hydrolase
VIKALLFALLAPLFALGALVGIFADPWAPWWVTAEKAQKVSGNAPGWQFSGASDPMLPHAGERVTPAQRYALARTAGFTPEDAVIATAVSMAENRSGDSALPSPTNRDGSIDIGLWQINSQHWAKFGGREAMTDPLRNAQAAYAIWSSSGWCAWFTFATSCGPNHRGTYAQFMDAARNAVAGAAAPEGPIQLESDILFRAIQPWLGVPYLFGGASLAGVDCSAFVQITARAIGVSLPRTAQAQYDATTRVSSPQVGDLVFFERTYAASERITHVGWVAGDGWMISASEPRVGRQNLNDPFWRARLAGYGRLRVPTGPQA